MTTVISGLGTAVPPHRIGRQAAAAAAGQLSCIDSRQTRKVEALYRRSGVQTRGSVLLEAAPDETVTQEFYPAAISADDRGPTTSRRGKRYAAEAPLLARQSSAAALKTSGVDASEITHLVTISCTGFNAPGFDIALIDDLGLPLTTQRVQIGFMGCHGAVNGLRAADGLIAANPGARVLLCSVELCSLHYQYGYDADRIVSGALFADGSAALVLSQQDATAESPVARNANGFGQVVATGSYLVPESRDAMTWIIGDHGFEMTLSATVPGLIQQQLKGFLTEWLAQYGESIDSIGGWAVHPGGARILSAVEAALSLDSSTLQASREVLAEHGNMSSATMLMILQRFGERQQPKPWLMLGFGPGLEIEVALIR